MATVTPRPKSTIDELPTTDKRAMTNAYGKAGSAGTAPEGDGAGADGSRASRYEYARLRKARSDGPSAGEMSL
ncbi:hypothetical protein [Halostagnicola bangensis]